MRAPDERTPSALERFLHHARADPSAIAVQDDASAPLTYGALLDAARQTARRLADDGARRGSRVAVECSYGARYLVPLLGCWLLGSVPVPVDPASPADRRRHQVRQARCGTAVTGPGTDGAVAGAVADVVSAHGGGGCGEPEEPAAYILFTSGSTGRPKGVEVEHPALLNMLEHFVRALGFGPGDRMLAHSSTVFDMSVPEMLIPLVSGGTVAVAPPRSVRNPELFADWLRSHPVDAAWATPSQLRLLLPFLRGDRVFGTLISGGEALPAELAGALRKVCGALWNAYGPTEVTVVGLCAEVEPPYRDPLPIGVPLTGLRAHVLDERQRPVPPGTAGELCLSGTGVARGYTGSPELTARSFVTGPDGERMYRTGDLVTRGTDGLHYFRGRGDDQVKIRGHRVELGDVEAAARRLPSVGQAVAVVSDLLSGRPDLFLAVVPPPGEAPPDPADLRRQLYGLLPAFMRPRQVLPFGALPRDSAGKTSRRAVGDLVEERLRGD
ncbi:amino acid adenylation domain-containing protein [Streptomyces pacificus]|uniref:Amino acid adenylation domain-containing protein n=1 Tax=Streptomyces pacificus TaxID=2705029 RepID=A0A6A0AZS5_9ACTN|nr:amino acid adenylation domain-containing protein [Streptomyces pacificus]GFH37943.1 amino acid adenylation domain-containing protein [Streptomyces pacificus]